MESIEPVPALSCYIHLSFNKFLSFATNWSFISFFIIDCAQKIKIKTL